jgi:predicted aspartyl protease
MISGAVNFGEGRIRLTVKGLQGQGREVHAIVDTGYSASLTLPALNTHSESLHIRAGAA